jgi:hypothetical protein
MNGEPEFITPAQRSYALSLLHESGLGTKVTVAWQPLQRRLRTKMGVGVDVHLWLDTMTKSEASRFISALKEEV